MYPVISRGTIYPVGMQVIDQGINLIRVRTQNAECFFQLNCRDEKFMDGYLSFFRGQLTDQLSYYRFWLVVSVEQ